MTGQYQIRLAASVFALFLSLTATARADDITIGVAGPMSGPLAAFGEQIRHGAQLAVEEINAEGGVLGRKIAIDVEDDACDPKQARSVASKFANEKVAAVFGHWCAAASMAASGVYGEEGILHIEVGALVSELTQRGLKTVFRVSATDKDFADTIAGYAVAHNPKGKVAIVTDTAGVTVALTKYMQSYFQSTPNKVVAVEEITGGEKDFSSTIDKLKALRPDVVICNCYTEEAGLFERQMQQKGMDLPYYGPDTFSSPDLVKIVGKDNTAKIVSIDYAHPPANDLYKHFAEEMQKHHWPMETQTAITYAAVMMFADAAKAANSLEAGKIADVLRNKTFPTVLGDVRFASNGDRIDPAFSTYQWVNGEIKMKESLPK